MRTTQTRLEGSWPPPTAEPHREYHRQLRPDLLKTPQPQPNQPRAMLFAQQHAIHSRVERELN
jgi:hypothetical protein